MAYQDKIISRSSQRALRVLSNEYNVENVFCEIEKHQHSAEKSFKIKFGENFIENTENYYIFGAGFYSREALLNRLTPDKTPLAVLDNNKNKWLTTHCNLPVISPQKLLGKGKPPGLVIVCAMESGAITQWLEENKIPYLHAETDGSTDFIPCAWLLKNKHRVFDIIEQLDDELSVKTLLDVIKGRVFQGAHFPMKGNWFLNNCVSGNQYFPTDIIKARSEEFFIDCGCHDGDTLIDFALFCQKNRVDNFSAIGIEADGALAEIAKANATPFFPAPPEIPVGCAGDHELDTARLRVSEPQKMKIINLDHLKIGSPPTYIKMDIEGNELDALSGASTLINKFQPRLGICAYHRTSHLIEIPEAIRALNPSYKLHIRHHKAGSPWETVCYGIPSE